VVGPSLARGGAVDGVGRDTLRSFGYVEIAEGYFLTVVDRGADFLLTAGRIGREQAEACKVEAPRRIAAGEFFGPMA
jgi:hypothetical protein